MNAILAQSIAELIAARYDAERRASFYRELSGAAIHKLHDQHAEIQRKQRQIDRMAAELRELRKQVVTSNNLTRAA